VGGCQSGFILQLCISTTLPFPSFFFLVPSFLARCSARTAIPLRISVYMYVCWALCVIGHSLPLLIFALLFLEEGFLLCLGFCACVFPGVHPLVYIYISALYSILFFHIVVFILICRRAYLPTQVKPRANKAKKKLIILTSMRWRSTYTCIHIRPHTYK
jgi:hypothetical protein